MKTVNVNSVLFFANDHYKGFGYGTQAIRLGIDYVTNTLKLEKIFADTMGLIIKCSIY